MSIEISVEKAVRLLVPNVTFSFDDNNIIDWDITNKGVSQPTRAEIDAKLVELKAEYDALAYSRARKIEYDALNQFEMQYDDEINGTTTWKDAIAKVKSDNPKPE